MSADDVQTDFVAIVEEVADLPTEEIRPDRALRADLGVDSLSLVEIVVATEERFGVRIPDEDAKQLRTVADYVSYVERARSA
jgi:acyl carrier protein